MKNSALLTWLPLALLAIAGCDGSENNVNQLFPEILVSPTEVDFGEVVKDYPATVALEIINGGRAPLKISSIVLRGDGVVPYAVDVTEAEIGWNNTEEDPTADREVVNLTFLPPNYFTYDAELVINSNDPNNPEWVVPVTGIGSDGPTPDIELEPMSLDYGDVTPGTISTKWVTIKNSGDGDLVINSTAQTGSGDFSIATDPRGQTIVAGGSVQMIVLYSPNIPDVEGEEIGDDGVITLTTNDPDESTVQIQVVGNGGSTFEYPIADIDCPGVGAPPETIVLDGSGSVDPMGYALIDYNWFFPNGEDDDCPDGSTCTLQASAGTTSELYMDIAGEYEVHLQVTNEIGVKSAAARCVIDAIPQDQIHVELLWDTPRADLDLHMSNATDVSLFDSPDDVAYCNPHPEWGDSSTTLDDPRLDIDDLSGYGPENINVEEPYTGEYPVRVHYFDDNGDGATTATVRFYIYGTLVETYSRVMERNEVWSVATIRWPEALVVEEDTVATASARSCF